MNPKQHKNRTWKRTSMFVNALVSAQTAGNGPHAVAYAVAAGRTWRSLRPY